jgi:hypothetical protein
VFLRRFPRTAVVYDLRSSWAVKEEILKAGGVPVRDRVGHSFMKATMRQKGAMFGGELSGHFYFAENFTADSGMIAMMAVLSLLTAPENKGKSLSQLLAGVRRYHSTGEINFHVADKAAMIAALKKRYAQGRQDELDGITVEFGEVGMKEWWWFNVRPSNTEPLLRMDRRGLEREPARREEAELIDTWEHPNDAPPAAPDVPRAGRGLPQSIRPEDGRAATSWTPAPTGPAPVVTGTVLDARTGKPLAGAVVRGPGGALSPERRRGRFVLRGSRWARRASWWARPRPA